MARTQLLGLSLVALAGCWTVDTGDNFIPPDRMLDEDFFYCRVQPEVITAHSCASGLGGEAGECHSDKSALRLNPAAETATPPECDGDTVIGDVPGSYMDNFAAVQLSVAADPGASPLLRRPTGMDSHPRVIFDAGSAEADLIVQWIAMGGS